MKTSSELDLTAEMEVEADSPIFTQVASNFLLCLPIQNNFVLPYHKLNSTEIEFYHIGILMSKVSQATLQHSSFNLCFSMFNFTF